MRLLRELTLLIPVRGVSSVAYIFGCSSSAGGSHRGTIGVVADVETADVETADVETADVDAADANAADIDG